jgi:tetratricopeptide (TPR) repeat protein
MHSAGNSRAPGDSRLNSLPMVCTLNSSSTPHGTRLKSRNTNRPALHLSPGKRRVFLIVTLLSPFLFVLLLELGLRIFGYGADLSLFVTEQIAGTSYHIMNPEVKHRYFSRVEFSPNTSPDYFPVPKPRGTFRIFCLGGSTTVGYPYNYVGSFSTFLRDKLNSTFPEKKLEVINLGMTATNSYTVVDIARELIHYEPDLFIVYDGHNEFYGALGSASHESFGKSRWLSRAYLRLIHFRAFLLFRNFFNGIHTWIGGAQVLERPGGTMMERLARGQYIPYKSSAYRLCLENFKANLEEFASLCRENTIPAILGTQVSNLRDLQPFVSNDGARDENAEIKEYLRQAGVFLAAKQIDSAMATVLLAIGTDSMRANAHYLLAQCYDNKGNARDALAEYLRARDLDMLRFRASTDFNDAIRNIADGRVLFVADIERRFMNESEHCLIGNTLMLEHLHPNARGYFLIAHEYASVMRSNTLFASSEEWEQCDTLSEERLWQQRALTELDELCAKKRTEILLAAWPFRTDPLHVQPSPTSDVVGHIADQIIGGKVSWEYGHLLAAQYYEGQGDFERTEQEYRTLINQLPLNVSPYIRLAQVMLRERKFNDAHDLLRTSLDVEKTPYALKALGSLAVDSGNLNEAITHFELAVSVSQSLNDKRDTRYMLALALARARQDERAVAELDTLLKLDPQFAPARTLHNQLRDR